MNIDTGDYIKHIPSGESWVVAFVEGNYLYACGWPLTRAHLSDCELIEKSTDEYRKGLLHEMLNMGDKTDPRQRYARKILEMTQDKPDRA